MRFSCDSCGAQYMISDEKVGPKGVRVRCKKCGNVVLVKHAPAEVPEVAPAQTPATPVESAPAGGLESVLERELGDAFDQAFTGGAPGASARVAVPEEPATAPAYGVALGPVELPAPPPPGQDALPETTGTLPGGVEAITDWYVAIDDVQVGPLEASGVKERWESGVIGPDTLAWRPGLADWAPISGIADMAQFLAPVPRGTPKPVGAPKAAAASAPVPGPELILSPPQPAPAPSPAAASPAARSTAAAAAVAAPGAGTNGISAGAEWKPSAASALAALANDELASLQQPERPAPTAAAKLGSLVDRLGLPEGGVDPTNVIPLPIKGLEPTNEAPLRPAREVAPPATRAATRRRSSKLLPFALAGVGLVALATAGAWQLGVFGGHQAPPPASPPPPAVTQAPAAPAPAAEQPAAPPASAAPAAKPEPTPMAVAPAEEPKSAPQPVAEAPKPAARPPPERAAPAERPAPAKKVATRPAAPSREPARPQPSRRAELAAAEAAQVPAEPPARNRSGGDPLLDVVDDGELERELAGRGSKRSVYVPPALGGSGDLPANVSLSQISEGVAGQRSALERCTEQQRNARPDVSGTLVLRWTIMGDGSVRDVRPTSEQFAREPVAGCIGSVVKGIRFPRSKTSGQDVTFQFKF